MQKVKEKKSLIVTALIVLFTFSTLQGCQIDLSNNEMQPTGSSQGLFDDSNNKNLIDGNLSTSEKRDSNKGQEQMCDNEELQGPSPQATGLNADEWMLTFKEEFDGDKLDTGKWNTSLWFGRTNKGNGELQWYVDDAFIFDNGIMKIKGEERECGPGYKYASGVITTMDNFAQKYGFFEIKAKVPDGGKGLWPAFWMLPNRKAWPPEIDILEFWGHEKDTVLVNSHWRDSGSSHKEEQFWVKGSDFTKDFHTFGVLWEQDNLTWYVDGDPINSIKNKDGVPQEKMYLVANLAIGGTFGGDPDENTRFPAYYEIDYIRAYKKAE